MQLVPQPHVPLVVGLVGREKVSICLSLSETNSHAFTLKGKIKPLGLWARPPASATAATAMDNENHFLKTVTQTKREILPDDLARVRSHANLE